MSEDCSAIIDQLIEQRHKQGKTQRQLAQDANLPQSVIARLESKKAIPQLDTLLKVASALGCDLALVPISEKRVQGQPVMAAPAFFAYIFGQ